MERERIIKKFMKHTRNYIFKNTVYKEINQSAKVVFRGPGELEVGPAPEFNGKPETIDPEEMFVAAINACLMTTFFYFAQKLQVEFLSYSSEAEGLLEKLADGFRFTNVEVRAKVTLEQTFVAAKIMEVGKLAEKYCLVSRSVNCPVNYQLEIEIKTKKPLGE
jgi:organic hydroperoxide reductase OsmC/OhrA